MGDLYKKVEKFVVDSFEKAGRQQSVRHFYRTVYWLQQLKPNAQESLLVAAIAHDIERASFGANDPILMERAKLLDDSVLEHHQAEGAKIISEFLKSMDAEKGFIKKVSDLIRYHEVGGDEDQNLLKDADSISYFENNAGRYISRYTPGIGKELVAKKINWMFNRITSNEAREIARPMYEKVIRELNIYANNS